LFQFLPSLEDQFARLIEPPYALTGNDDVELAYGIKGSLKGSINLSHRLLY